MPRLATLVLLVLAAGCAPAESTFLEGSAPWTDVPEAALECTTPQWSQGLSGLTVGDKVTFDAGRIAVLIEDLQDSRCPEDAVCIWAGRVDLALQVRVRGIFSEHEVSTDARDLDLGERMLRLEDVTRGGKWSHGRAAPPEITLGLTSQAPVSCPVVI